MYVIQNSLKNLARNKGRNILLSAIIFAIVATTVVTLSITRTAEGIIDDYHARFGSEVIIGMDIDAVRSLRQQLGGGAIPQLTPEQSLAFSRSQYVMSYNMTATHGADSSALTAIGAGEENIMNQRGAMGGGFIGAGDEFVTPNFRVVGGGFEEFSAGDRHLLEGSIPAEYGEALISIDVAELNNLSVGDTIELESSMIASGSMIVRNITRTLTITGIYLDASTDSMPGMFNSPETNRQNEILTTIDTVLAQMAVGELGITINATYFLHDPAYLSAFEAEMRAGGLSDLMTVSTDEAAFNAVVQPVIGLRSIAQTFMIVVLVLGALVLLLLSSMAIRERKYEIGVLRAMGMKKRKLAFGLWAETLCLTVICLVIGLGVGSVVAQPVSDMLLAAQVESAAQETAANDMGMMGMMGGRMANRGGMMGGMFGGTNTNVTPLDELDISLGAGTIAEIIGISLLLTSLAAIISITRITKYEPIKILMERN